MDTLSFLGAIVSEYSANLDADAYWADDWSQGDDWHTRGDSLWLDYALASAAIDKGHDLSLGIHREHDKDDIFVAGKKKREGSPQAMVASRRSGDEAVQRFVAGGQHIEILRGSGTSFKTRLGLRKHDTIKQAPSSKRPTYQEVKAGDISSLSSSGLSRIMNPIRKDELLKRNQNLRIE